VPGGLCHAGFGLVRAMALRDFQEIFWSSGRSRAGCGVSTNGIWATHEHSGVQIYSSSNQLIAGICHVSPGKAQSDSERPDKNEINASNHNSCRG
jgi:hypothetical protein